jgi:hypothetical protein
MKTAGRENPNRTATLRRNRAHGVARQNRSCSVEWAAKQEKFQPKEMCFFLTSTFIEPVEPPSLGHVIKIQKVGGLHHLYMHKAARSKKISKCSRENAERTVRSFAMQSSVFRGRTLALWWFDPGHHAAAYGFLR